MSALSERVINTGVAKYLTKIVVNIITKATFSRQYENALENKNEHIVNATGSKNKISKPSATVAKLHSRIATMPDDTHTRLIILMEDVLLLFICTLFTFFIFAIYLLRIFKYSTNFVAAFIGLTS